MALPPPPQDLSNPSTYPAPPALPLPRPRVHFSIAPAVPPPFPQNLSLPLLQPLVDEVENNIQAPRALIFSSALAAVSTALQGLVDVRKPNGQIVPTSLFCLTIAESGERKSTVDNIFMEPIRTFEAKHLEENASLNSTWRKELELWNLRLKSQKKAISKLLDKGEDTSLEEERLLALLESEPSKKRAFKMLYEDATSEALFQGLHFNLPSAGLITSDGAGVLAGRAFNDLSKLNSIWSNDAITVDRASAESFTLNGARLSILIQAQEQIFSDYLEKNGKTALGSGLWARFLVCKPRSRIGTRFNANSTQLLICI